uniref:Uncharacterized protein n=1 Tax=Hyaloperonospora arabidopsidis (strain Emoy2) TaxID=559515 RepID=M4B1V4_HYAAE
MGKSRLSTAWSPKLLDDGGVKLLLLFLERRMLEKKLPSSSLALAFALLLRLFCRLEAMDAKAVVLADVGNPSDGWEGAASKALLLPTRRRSAASSLRFVMTELMTGRLSSAPIFTTQDGSSSSSCARQRWTTSRWNNSEQTKRRDSGVDLARECGNDNRRASEWEGEKTDLRELMDLIQYNRHWRTDGSTDRWDR